MQIRILANVLSLMEACKSKGYFLRMLSQLSAILAQGHSKSGTDVSKQ